MWQSAGAPSCGRTPVARLTGGGSGGESADMSRVRSCARPHGRTAVSGHPLGCASSPASRYRFEYAVLRHVSGDDAEGSRSELPLCRASTRRVTSCHRSIERYRHGHPCAKGVRVIGIDEVSYHKRHKYRGRWSMTLETSDASCGSAREQVAALPSTSSLRLGDHQLTAATRSHRCHTGCLRHERSVHGRLTHDSLPQCIV